MYDLHMHTNRSDGSDTWQEILQKAEEAGLAGISITDHDHCRVYREIERPERYFSGVLIPGVELQAMQNGISLELLGYGIDTVKMDECINGLYLPADEINLALLTRLYAKCVAAGMEFAPGVVENYSRDIDFYATHYLHDEMRKFPANRRFVEDDTSWAHENIFFRRYTANPESAFFVEQADLAPSAEQVIEAIHACGGRAFVPHIYQYDENSEPLLQSLLKLPIDGIECYYPTFTPAQTAFLLETCKKHGLKISGGSDYHGAFRPANRLGMTGVEPEMFF